MPFLNFFYQTCNIRLSTFVKPLKPLIMSTPLPKRLLFILLVAAALFILTLHTAPAQEIRVCEKETPARLQTAGTQLLWESLSRQFVAANPF